MQLHQTIENMAGRDSLIHSRLALLQLISEVAEAFQEERIAASHANLSHSYRRGPQEKPLRSAGGTTSKVMNRICSLEDELSSGLMSAVKISLISYVVIEGQR